MSLGEQEEMKVVSLGDQEEMKVTNCTSIEEDWGVSEGGTKKFVEPMVMDGR